jgi:hypothetical protein
MKTQTEINNICEKLAEYDTIGVSKYPQMTYEQGVLEALMWVLGELPDEEFSPAQ